MKAKWYRTDEKENAIDYLETAAAAFNAANQTHKWKWLTIALHGALYGSAVLAVVGTDPDRVLFSPKSKQVPESEEQPKKLISLWEALRRCQSDEWMLLYVGSQRLVISDSEMSSINRLSDTFRNNFEHFTPKHWSIEVSGFPGIVSDVCRVIGFLFLESGNVRLTSSQRRRIVAALRELIGHNRKKPH